MYTVQNITQLSRMYTALRRGLSQIKGGLKPFCTVDFPHSGKAANKWNSPHTLKETSIWGAHESSGNANDAAVLCPSTAQAVQSQQGRGSSGYRRFFSYPIKQHKHGKKKKPTKKPQTSRREERKTNKQTKQSIQHLQEINLEPAG